MKRALATLGIVILIITVFNVLKGTVHELLKEPKEICVKSHTETKWVYEYGFNMLNGKYETSYHPKIKNTCLQYAPNPRYTGEK